MSSLKKINPATWLDRSLQNYGGVLVIYVIIFLAFSFPFWGLGEVIAPNIESKQIGLTGKITGTHLESNRYGDFAKSYIPAIEEHLHAPKSGHLVHWSQNNQLGRPTYHLAGFSPAYLPTKLFFFLEDPYRVITILSLFGLFFSGFIFILFSKELGFLPITALIISIGFAFSNFFLYWITFPMFPHNYCWSMGILYGIKRLLRIRDLQGILLISFSIYSLLILARPQAIVGDFYLLAVYTLVLLRQAWKQKEHVPFILYLGGSLLFGALLTTPILLDTFHMAFNSLRTKTEADFFLTVLPKVTSLEEGMRYLLSITLPEVIANPLEHRHPLKIAGFFVTLLLLYFALMALQTRFKQTWGWMLAVVIPVMMAFFEPIFLFAMKYLGFGLSRSNPLGMITLPLAILAVYGAESLLRASNSKERFRLSLTSLLIYASLLFLAVIYASSRQIGLEIGMVGLHLFLLLLLGLQIRKINLPILLLTVLLSISFLSFPLLLRQDRNEIANSSPLLEAVKRHLPQDTRIAIQAPGIKAFPPNYNARHGIASIHSYNSLSPMEYHRLIESLGSEARTYGRYNDQISPDYASPQFWMSNVGLVLSPIPLEHPNLLHAETLHGIHLYRTGNSMGEALQILQAAQGDSIELKDPRKLSFKSVNKLLDQGDLLEFGLESSADSLLLLSQIHHPHWRAEAFSSEAWNETETLVINGSFQGVKVPEGTTKIRLIFLPYSRFMWISNILLSALLLFLALSKRKEILGFFRTSSNRT